MALMISLVVISYTDMTVSAVSDLWSELNNIVGSGWLSTVLKCSVHLFICSSFVSRPSALLSSLLIGTLLLLLVHVSSPTIH